MSIIKEIFEIPLLTDEQFEKMSLKQKAFYPFTDKQWNALSKDQKKRVFFARQKFANKKQDYVINESLDEKS
jgi:hypothetical protein